jgi:hypothetical protein
MGSQDLLGLLSLLEAGKVSVDSTVGSLMEVDADTRHIAIHADTMKALGLSLSPIRRLFGLRATLGFPRKLYGLGWSLAILFSGEPILIAGRGTSSITDHVHVSLRHLLDLA